KVRALLVESFHATYAGLHGVARLEDLITHLFSPAALKTRLVRKDSEFLVADDGRNIGGMCYAAMSQALTKTVMLHLMAQ
ncbi:GNAT family N-acetyltransferase, partial [Rhizobium ruizarguesonis]